MTYIKGSPNHWTADMTDTITIYKQSTLDNYGKRATSASGTTYSCRIMSDVKRTRDDKSRTVQEDGRLIILNDPDVAIGDRLVLPDSREPIITAVDKVSYNANGVVTPHHVVVTFGRA